MPEQTSQTPTDETDLDNLIRQGFECDPENLANSSWLSTTGCTICWTDALNWHGTAGFHFQGLGELIHTWASSLRA
eukprot:351371-Pelagomonas_calceolata.AAC.1